MRIRLGYAMELVVVVASGLGLARWVTSQPSITSSTAADFFEYRLRCLVEPMLAGLALAGGFGLAFEVARRRSPGTWGVGRWCWSVASLTIALRVSQIAAVSVLRVWRRGGSNFWPGATINGTNSLTSTFTVGGVGWAFAAAWITSRIVGGPIDPAPDAREWSGRILLAGIVGCTVAFQALMIVT